jgi:hypothetical protein
VGENNLVSTSCSPYYSRRGARGATETLSFWLFDFLVETGAGELEGGPTDPTDRPTVSDMLG